jgi:D-3-phosphoglycerate dehydrogenase
MKGRKAYHVVVAEPFDSAAVARLEEVGTVTVLEDSGPASLLAAVGGADALLIRSKAHVTARIIEAAPRLKVIGRASPNVDHIDLRAARRRNISVVYAPHVAVASTAEFALAMILSLHRRIPFFDRQVRDGKFESLRTPAGHELSRLTLGLLGVDPVAEILGRICSAAFQMEIAHYDPSGRQPTDFSSRALGLDDLLAQADILSVHLAVSPQTRGLLDASRLARLKPTTLLVNVSRGPIVDTQALAHALKRRQIAGAAMDVYEVEPLPADHPLRSAPHCILTPHVGGATLDASAERFHVTEDVVRVLTGEAPRYPFIEPP